MEFIDKYVDKFYNAMVGYPKMGLLFIIFCLFFLLLGIILNWKWTYERGSFWPNILQEFIPESLYRIIVGIIVAIALLSCIIIFLFY